MWTIWQFVILSNAIDFLNFWHIMYIVCRRKCHQQFLIWCQNVEVCEQSKSFPCICLYMFVLAAWTAPGRSLKCESNRRRHSHYTNFRTPYGDRDLGQHCLRQWLVAWWHQAITWTNVDFLSLKSSDIHIRTILQEMPQPSITKICLKIISKILLKFPRVHWVDKHI